MFIKVNYYKLSLPEMIGEKDKKKASTGAQALPTLKIVDSKYLIKNKKLGEGSFA